MQMNSRSVVQIEDIMTPRSLLLSVPRSEFERAPAIAYDNEFDAVPITEEHGGILSFWARETGRVQRISRRFRAEHSAAVESVLPRLARHTVQFVHYRAEVVGLVDLSDLNKPLARLVFLHPMLQCEQTVLSVARARNISDDDVASALGRDAAKHAMGKRKSAKRENLDAPLLEFASFGDVLRAAVELRILEVDSDDIDRLNVMRNRLAHGAKRPVQHADDGGELLWCLKACADVTQSVSVH